MSDRIKELIEDIEDTLEKSGDGDMDYSDIGDYFVNGLGMEIINVLHNLKDR